MSLKEVQPGSKAPEEVNVVIEIPAHSDPVKYEVDKETGAIFVDRFMSTTMFYPCNYGYVPATLSADGDPVDVLVHTPHNVISGTVIVCRPVGILKMTDEAGSDAKIIAVPIRKSTPLYDDVNGIEDLSQLLRSQIKHFFEHYKDLEKGKWVRIDGWGDVDEAIEEIRSSMAAYDNNS